MDGSIAHPQQIADLEVGQGADRDFYIYILDDIIENVSVSAPALVPLFRSDQQLRLLGVLFAGAEEELAIGELAARASIAQATASREVARLEEHGLVVTRAIGRNRLVRPNWRLPWAPELRSILVQTVGVLGRLGEALRGVQGVDCAFVFGSWAARHQGEPGPFPNDVDVVVIGTAPLRAIRRECRMVGLDLRVDITPVVIDRQRWDSPKPEPFIAQLKEQPLVPIPLEVERDN
ncbi:MAG: winged helix-turn-helix domain-containing protein [bacterium]|nr:winged helix-turn-helix domain-containing protein [bacterium]